MAVDPLIPRYPQPEVLKITGLRPAVLQTWVNRKVIELVEQNPGSGRRRLYCKLDVVKLAVMRRLADLSIDLAISKDLAEAVAEELDVKNLIEWETFVCLRPRNASEEAESRPAIVKNPPPSRLDAYLPQKQYFEHLRVSELAERPDFLRPLRRPPVADQPFLSTKERPVDEDAREFWARRGVHAEPFIFVPLGEIVNGTLAQLEALDEANAAEAAN